MAAIPFCPLAGAGHGLLPEDIAKAVAFLASRDAAWITGTTLTVDGGEMPPAVR